MSTLKKKKEIKHLSPFLTYQITINRNTLNVAFSWTLFTVLIVSCCDEILSPSWSFLYCPTPPPAPQWKKSFLCLWNLERYYLFLLALIMVIYSLDIYEHILYWIIEFREHELYHLSIFHCGKFIAVDKYI